MIFVFIGLAVFVAGSIYFIIWDIKRKKKRRDSLRQRDDGMFIWFDFDGSERESDKHPEEEGGEWYMDSSNPSNDFDGDGGGGGDD